METRLKSRFEGVVRHRLAQSSPPISRLFNRLIVPARDPRGRTLVTHFYLERAVPLAFHRPLFATAGPRIYSVYSAETSRIERR